MIGAGEPERVPAPHPLEADQDVLHGVVESVAHVQTGRHVGRRHHDHVGPRRRSGSPAAREPAVLPPAIEVRLDPGRVVLRSERLGHAVWSAGRGGPGRRSSSPRTRRQLISRTDAGPRRAGPCRPARGTPGWAPIRAAPPRRERPPTISRASSAERRGGQSPAGAVPGWRRWFPAAGSAGRVSRRQARRARRGSRDPDHPAGAPRPAGRRRIPRGSSRQSG